MIRLRELVDQANALWAPQERPFTSSLPLLGPVIVSLRRAWNWMSAKWYVRPILEQQIAFNSTVVQIINEMYALLEGQGQRLEKGLAQLQVQIEEAEEWMMANDRANTALARDLASLSHRLNEMGSLLPREMSALRDQVRALEQALRGTAAMGGEDADSLL